jgi:serine/threonine-protein kinase
MVRAGSVVGGKYSILRELGRGGMATVFAAVNTWTGRPVAIKMLRAEQAQSRVIVERFWREARATAKLRHPNLIDVLDVGVDAKTRQPFIVQEFLNGETLEHHTFETPEHRLMPARTLKLLLPVMEALDACHRIGVIHRDVKPSNIFLARAEDGTVTSKLLDFGIARLLVSDGRSYTQTGDAIGTPMYMSPEQARGETDIDARADVWAMGVTLFETLTGRMPFEGNNAHVVLAQVLASPAPPIRDVAPDIPPDLAQVVDRALTHDRKHRTASIRELIDALKRCEAGRDPALQAPVAPREVAAQDDDVQPSFMLDEARSSEATSWSVKKGFAAAPSPWIIAGVLAPFVVVLGFIFARASSNESAAPNAPVTRPAPSPAEPPVTVVTSPTVTPSANAPDASVAAPLTENNPRAAVAPSRRSRRVTTPPPAPAVTQPPPPAPVVEPPVVEAPRDPLAPDETPYSQIRRRSQRR